MCRLLGYLGPPVDLETLLYKPEHSLVVQSYKPLELKVALLNADGFGVGWYHPQRHTEPYTYRNTLPIWNDGNLPSLSRYIESGCVVANVRSATPGQAVDLSNCHPFQYQQFLFSHNGFIENFRATLYRPLRDRLCDPAYRAIQGSTDSEHLFGYFLHEWLTQPGISLTEALQRTLSQVAELATHANVAVQANVLLSDGQTLLAARFSTRPPAPSLYWLRDDPFLPGAIVVASEPLFMGDWVPFAENSLLSVGANQHVHLIAL
ncbi:ergothioneine biosynthesis protein EgtC [Trichothermofontia sp.]